MIALRRLRSGCEQSSAAMGPIAGVGAGFGADGTMEYVVPSPPQI